MEAHNGQRDVRATCRFCGEVPVPVAAVRCAIESLSAAQGLCELACPICSRTLTFRTDAAVVGLLLLEGAGAISGSAPFEALEPHAGSALSWDEVLDAKVAMSATCCPQDELTSPSGR